MHKNTTKSNIVTHDNSTMLPPHCNAKLMTVNNIQPWRVKFKTPNPHQPSSLDRGDHPITKYTTVNTEISHMQEQQSVSTFAREKSNPCNPGLYRFPRYLSQQEFEKQLNATPRQQGRPTSARFFAKKHQFDPIVQRKNQNHGQADKILHHPTMQMLGTLQYTLHTKNMAKNTAVAVPKANGQMPETSAPTDRHNPQDRTLLQQETDIKSQTTGKKQQGNTTATDRKRIQMEIYAPTGSAQTCMEYPSDSPAVVPQNAINYTLAKDIKTDLNERKEDRQDFNEIQPDTTKPEDTSYAKDFPPLPTSYGKDLPPLQDGTASIPPSAQSPPTIVEVIYVPSLLDQINFHLTRRTWYETAMNVHYQMAFQHHQTAPVHNWQLDLSRLAHQAANQHAYQFGLARQALIFENER